MPGQFTALPGETMYYSGCTANCGCQCVLRVFVRDGRITRIESDNRPDHHASPEVPPAFGKRAMRACLRGRAMRQYVYAPDRIKSPMRRAPGAKRGEGRFVPISWEEALRTIAAEWLRVLDTYGPQAVHKQHASGTTSSGMTRGNEWYRLANLMGGHLDVYGTYSTAQISAALPYMYGCSDGNSISDMAHSRLVLMFGCNIMETRQSGGGLSYALLQAKRAGKAKIICIDPRCSDTMTAVGDEWVAIRPGSDSALAAALAHVLITEQLVDNDFLARYCLGFDSAHMPDGVPPDADYSSYILGKGPDGIAKTPGWAAEITGCPAERIVSLARELGTVKPACVIQGWGPQRHANGDEQCRAIAALAVLTGNVGISGGNAGGTEGVDGIAFENLPVGENSVPERISFYTWPDAMDDYQRVTAADAGLRGATRLKSGIKFVWNSSGNSLINQHSDINATRKILEDESKCEFITVVETRLTASAMFADILLPSVTPPEQDDLIRQGYRMDQSSLLIARKAIEPLHQARSQYDICAALAAELARQTGRPQLLHDYTEGRSQLDWVKFLYEKARDLKPELPANFDTASEIGFFSWEHPPHIAFQDFRRDPAAHPLATPSGKIELFSRRLWQLNTDWNLPAGESINALPIHVATAEGPSDTQSARHYPFQIIGHHYKGRTHSMFAGLPWLERTAPHMVWMNPLDAAERGIRHGDMLRIFNERGALLAVVKVTPRIMPGVLSLPQGAWYKPATDGTDTGGCINTLTKTHMTPLAKGNPQHTTRVDVCKSGPAEKETTKTCLGAQREYRP